MFYKTIQLKYFFLIFFLFLSLLGTIKVNQVQAGCCYCIRDTDGNPCPNTERGSFSRCWVTDSLQNCMNNISSELYHNRYIWGWDGNQSGCNNNPYSDQYSNDNCQRHFNNDQNNQSNSNNNSSSNNNSQNSGFIKGLVPCGRNQDDGNPNNGDETAPCTLCHLVVGVQRIINWLMHILTYVAIAALVAAGVFYIVSAGNEKMLEMAKGYIKAILIGFGVALAGWVLVNYTLYLFSATSQGGGFLHGLTSGEHWWDFKCDTNSDLGIPNEGAVSGNEGGGVSGSEGTPSPGNYEFNDYILSAADISNPQQQQRDASPDLINLLKCMKDRIPERARILSSISDSHGMDNCVNHWNNSSCAHGEYSCHYGGRNCRGESYAVDFKDENYYNEIRTAALNCGASAIFYEGNHIHVSVSGNRCGCH